jgi:hypothetical protein
VNQKGEAMIDPSLTQTNNNIFTDAFQILTNLLFELAGDKRGMEVRVLA